MAQIQLLFLALLASSIGVGARSINYVYNNETGIAGKVPTDCENLILLKQRLLKDLFSIYQAILSGQQGQVSSPHSKHRSSQQLVQHMLR
jgi:hypothetical protein